MDNTNCVTLSLDDFAELHNAAYNPTPLERVASVTQTTFVLCVCAGVVTLGGYGLAKVSDWREERTFQRAMRKADHSGTSSK